MDAFSARRAAHRTSSSSRARSNAPARCGGGARVGFLRRILEPRLAGGVCTRGRLVRYHGDAPSVLQQMLLGYIEKVGHGAVLIATLIRHCLLRADTVVVLGQSERRPCRQLTPRYRSSRPSDRAIVTVRVELEVLDPLR